MKTQNLFCAAAILSLALSIPTYAGDVQTPTIPPPPPPPAAAPDSVNTTVDSDASSDLLIELLGMLSFY
jgi:hypothetical protein